MINLFEYQNKVEKEELFKSGFEEFLDEIWNKREKNSYYADYDEEKIEAQRFLQFIHKSNELKASNYVGVIYFNGERINLLPKIFFDENLNYNEEKISVINAHILWWLSYCRKFRFPSYKTSLGSVKGDFFEIMIYLFAKYAKELLGKLVYQQFEEVKNELPYLKGRLNINKYLSENFVKGNWHKLNCVYDAFVIDNEFNRILKHVTNLLFNVTANQENKKNLREILFILDEVSDVAASAEQCQKITFNPIFSEFEILKHYCLLFLQNSISFNYKNELKLFAFLLPMEYVFEDFVFGFIEREIENIKIKAQIRNTYLDEAKQFLIKPDVYLEINGEKFIVDTKYKIIYTNKKELNKEISQNDLYQMITYAIRFGTDKVFLFYPDTIKSFRKEHIELLIDDILADKTISIKIFQLPIINRELLNQDVNERKEISKTSRIDNLFEPTKRKLIEKINEIFPNILS